MDTNVLSGVLLLSFLFGGCSNRMTPPEQSERIYLSNPVQREDFSKINTNQGKAEGVSGEANVVSAHEADEDFRRMSNVANFSGGSNFAFYTLLLFEFNNIALNTAGGLELVEVSQTLKLNPEINILIVSYDGELGFEMTSSVSSKSRALVVANHLNSLGVANSRICVRGDSEPTSHYIISGAITNHSKKCHVEIYTFSNHSMKKF
jgi:outer membrane protein OmpA-like peptidoglycan-associated protein